MTGLGYDRMTRTIHIPVPADAIRDLLLTLAVECRHGNNAVTMLFDDLATVAHTMDDTRDLPGGGWEQAARYRDEAMAELLAQLPDPEWTLSPEQADDLADQLVAAAHNLRQPPLAPVPDIRLADKRQQAQDLADAVYDRGEL